MEEEEEEEKSKNPCGLKTDSDQKKKKKTGNDRTISYVLEYDVRTRRRLLARRRRVVKS